MNFREFINQTLDIYLYGTEIDEEEYLISLYEEKKKVVYGLKGFIIDEKKASDYIVERVLIHQINFHKKELLIYIRRIK